MIVLAQRTRSYFSCQNLEVNIIRFPVCGTGCGGGCNTGCGAGCATGCGNDCGYGDACGCEPECTPIAFSMCGMCGVRYFRIDDDFYYGSQWASGAAAAYRSLELDQLRHQRRQQPDRSASRLEHELLRRLQVELLLQLDVRRVQQLHREPPARVGRQRRLAVRPRPARTMNSNARQGRHFVPGRVAAGRLV